MERAAVLVRGNQVTSADLGFLEYARPAAVSSIVCMSVGAVRPSDELRRKVNVF